jgi:indole-3-glycerol phosphate synthase
MATILDELAAYAKERVTQSKRNISYENIRREAETLPNGSFEFEKALGRQGLSLICECKKASPSKGLISPEFPYLEIAKDYEKAGADCISVLTEPKWFLGSDKYLEEIAKAVSTPCIRKDFTVDDYMIYEAKVLGAKAVLLICSILDPKQLEDYLSLCNELGLSALVEAHDEREIDTALSLNVSPKIIGVNNRNLKDFSVDTNNSLRLRNMIPKDVLFVSESGIATPEDARKAYEMGADAVLVGEMLMRSSEKEKLIREMKAV